jgi:hypothetical protein
LGGAAALMEATSNAGTAGVCAKSEIARSGRVRKIRKGFLLILY